MSRVGPGSFGLASNANIEQGTPNIEYRSEMQNAKHNYSLTVLAFFCSTVGRDAGWTGIVRSGVECEYRTRNIEY
jgi:hypothetical protein